MKGLIVFFIATLGFTATASIRMHLKLEESAPLIKSPAWDTEGQKIQHGDATDTQMFVDQPDNVEVGDLIIIIASSRQNPQPVPTPTGFTLIHSEGAATNVGHIIAFYRIADGTEPATFVMAGNPNDTWFAASARVTGHDPLNPIGPNTSGANSGTTGTSSLALPSMNTTATDSLLVAAWMKRNNSTSSSVPAGMDEIWQINSIRPLTVAGTERRPTAGATGTRTGTWASNGRAAGLMFEVLSAGAPLFADSSGNDNHGTCTACPTPEQPGAFGLAADFPGNAEILVTTNASLDFGFGDLSISAWIYPTSIGTNRGIVDRADGGAAGPGFRLLIDNTDSSRLRFVRGSLFNDGSTSNAGVITLNRWNHVVASLNGAGATVSFFSNGVAVGTGGVGANSATAANTEIHIGNKSYAASSVGFFDGFIDEVTIYGNQLSRFDVQLLYQRDSVKYEKLGTKPSLSPFEAHFPLLGLLKKAEDKIVTLP